MMEKALKERIIGAIVLVAVAVLVVPVFLDGSPSQGEVISERVPLPGQSEQDSQARTQTVVLDRDRDQPVPARTEAQTNRAPATTVVTTPAPAETSATTTEPPPQPAATQPATDTPATVQTAASATGMWAVQLGSFSNKDNANKLAADLRKEGFAAFLSQVSGPSGQLHRVRVGPQKDREAADAMAARLQRAGHTVKVLPHP